MKFVALPLFLFLGFNVCYQGARIGIPLQSAELNWLGLVSLPLLLLANAFFVAAEFALVSIRRARVAELVAQDVAGAGSVETALARPDLLIAATQLGITLFTVAQGVMSEPAVTALILPVTHLNPWLQKVDETVDLSRWIALLLVTGLTVVIGELVPKSIALQYPERTSLVVAGPLLWTERIFRPFIYLLNTAGRVLLHWIGVRPAPAQEMVHSVEELLMLVDASAESGVVEEEESEMLHAVFDFGDLVVRQVMIPRTEIVAVQANASLDEMIALTSTSTFTKFPTYEDDLDHILGIVHVRSLLEALSSPDRRHDTARRLAREALFVPETLPVSGLLRQFRVHRQHMAIVLDEFGGTAGLVTLQDLLEEIVGEVRDPFDNSTPEILLRPDGTYLIDGLALIETVNNQLGLELCDPDYDTIAGFVLGKLRRMPRLNDSVESDGIRLRVEEMDGLRIARLSLLRLPAASPTS